MPPIVKLFAVRSLRSASILGGILLQPDAKPARSHRRGDAQHRDRSKTIYLATSRARGEQPGVSHYLSEQLQTLGSLAGGIAFSLGMEVLGIPSVKQLLGDLIGGNEREENSNGMGQSSQNNAQDRFSRNFASSHRPSHNGSNSPEEFDPIV